MPNDQWSDRLKSAFEELARIEERKKETLEALGHFYEFIAEPAFESLSGELRAYKIKTRYGLAKDRTIRFRLSYPRSRIDHFHYILILPENSAELRFTLRLRGRRSMSSVLVDREEPFLENVPPADLLRLDKETLILDVIQRYFDFEREARTSPSASGR